MAHLPLREPDDDLIPLLRSADRDDLDILVGFIMQASTQELNRCPGFLFSSACDYTLFADDIAGEIQRFGGNSVLNVLRNFKGIPYAEVLRDVADKLDVNYNTNTDAATIEGQIQLKVLEKAYEKMDDDQRKQLLDAIGADHKGGIPPALPTMAIQAAIRLGGFAAYQIAVIVANAIATKVLGHGLSRLANTILTRSMSIFAGPIGWAITILWTIFDVAGPAYRITIPCVLQVAYIRQKTLFALCLECGNPNPKAAKFCQTCGQKLA